MLTSIPKRRQVGSFSVKLLDYIRTTVNSEIASTIRIFGINAKGNSICCNVHNFIPYFYIELPRSLQTITPPEVDEIKDIINKINTLNI